MVIKEEKADPNIWVDVEDTARTQDNNNSSVAIFKINTLHVLDETLERAIFVTHRKYLAQ